MYKRQLDGYYPSIVNGAGTGFKGRQQTLCIGQGSLLLQATMHEVMTYKGKEKSSYTGKWRYLCLIKGPNKGAGYI